MMHSKIVKKLSSILAAAVLSIVVFGCRSCETIDSSKLDPSEIYQEYSVTVSDTTTVSAEFRVSGSTGTTIALVSPSKIEHNGKVMAGNVRTIFSGTYYSAENDGFVGSHTFVLTDSSGRQYQNTVEFEPIRIASDSVTLSVGAKTAVIPLSRGLADGESITAQLTSGTEPPKPNANTNGGNSNSMAPAGFAYSTNPKGSIDNNARTFTIDTDNLRNFAPGRAKLYITLSASRKPANVGIRGGQIYYSIQSPTVTATVTN